MSQAQQVQKPHCHCVHYLAFCTAEHLVSIMRGRSIILDLFICLLRPLQPNKTTLTSPKNHTSTLSHHLFFVKMDLFFTLRKNLYSQNRSSRPVTPKSVPTKIGPVGPILAEIFANWSPRTTFDAKIGPAGPLLAAKTGLPLPSLVLPVKCKFVTI